MYLIDTDIIIDILRGVKGSKEFLLDISNEGIFLSVISMAEIFSGKETRDPIKHENEKVEGLKVLKPNYR